METIKNNPQTYSNRKTQTPKFQMPKTFTAFNLEYSKLFDKIHQLHPDWKSKQIIQTSLLRGAEDILTVEDKPSIIRGMKTIVEEERLMVLQLREQEMALKEVITAIDVLTKICSTIHNLHETRLNEPYKSYYHAGILSYTPEHVLNLVKGIKKVYLGKVRAEQDDRDRSEIHRDKQSSKPTDMINNSPGNPFNHLPNETDQSSFNLDTIRDQEYDYPQDPDQAPRHPQKKGINN
jgi:hypothetical protein